MVGCRWHHVNLPSLSHAGKVVAARHFSPLKAQVVAGGLVGGAALGLSSTLGGAWLGSVEVFTLAAVAAAWAGLWARGRSIAERNKVNQEQVGGLIWPACMRCPCILTSLHYTQQGHPHMGGVARPPVSPGAWRGALALDECPP